jgi:ferric-dicitrate binding protein FerR (iron transport regulator)
MMPHEDDANGNDDELLPRLFQALGPQPALPDDMKRAWEATFGRELSRHNALRRRQRRQRYLGAAVAAAVVLAIATAVLTRDPPAIAAVAHVVTVVGDNESSVDGTSRLLQDGDSIGVEETIRSAPDAYLALRYRDADVRLNSDTVVITHPTRLQLVRGAIYVDAGPVPSRGPTLTIETAFGTLAHVGTQFVVSLSATEMRAAVREGSIAMNAADERRTISAADGAREAVVTADGIAVSTIAPVGGPFGWVVAAAPGYPIDGASADQFLVWAARQLGAELDYASDATRIHARLVVLHGDLHASVAQGLAMVDATTDLSVDRSDPARLRVVQR